MVNETAKRELMGVFPNEIIRASAGTGKTFALSNRYLKLLASGTECQTILATTFTKKGAGETVLSCPVLSTAGAQPPLLTTSTGSCEIRLELTLIRIYRSEISSFFFSFSGLVERLEKAWYPSLGQIRLLPYIILW